MRKVIAHTGFGKLRPEHVDLMTYCHACQVGHAKFHPAPRMAKAKSTKWYLTKTF